jgi:hypothetical protein
MKIKKRIPKEGCWFAGIRLTAFLAKSVGAVIAIGGIASSISLFIKSIPDIISALQNLDQGFALFGLTIIATYIGVPAGLGCAGIISIGLGFLFDFISTKPNEQAPIDKGQATT